MYPIESCNWESLEYGSTPPICIVWLKYNSALFIYLLNIIKSLKVRKCNREAKLPDYKMLYKMHTLKLIDFRNTFVNTTNNYEKFQQLSIFYAFSR